MALLSPPVVGGEVTGVTGRLAQVRDLAVDESIEQRREPLAEAPVLVWQAVETQQERTAELERHQFLRVLETVATFALLDVFVVSRAVQKAVEVLQFPPVRIRGEFQHGVQRQRCHGHLQARHQLHADRMVNQMSEALGPELDAPGRLRRPSGASASL